MRSEATYWWESLPSCLNHHDVFLEVPIFKWAETAESPLVKFILGWEDPGVMYSKLRNQCCIKYPIC